MSNCPLCHEPVDPDDNSAPIWCGDVVGVCHSDYPGLTPRQEALMAAMTIGAVQYADLSGDKGAALAAIPRWRRIVLWQRVGRAILSGDHDRAKRSLLAHLMAGRNDGGDLAPND